jgi:hypothetical protein
MVQQNDPFQDLGSEKETAESAVQTPAATDGFLNEYLPPKNENYSYCSTA